MRINPTGKVQDTVANSRTRMHLEENVKKRCGVTQSYHLYAFKYKSVIERSFAMSHCEFTPT